jgi:hypothetical protein
MTDWLDRSMDWYTQAKVCTGGCSCQCDLEECGCHVFAALRMEPPAPTNYDRAMAQFDATLAHEEIARLTELLEREWSRTGCQHPQHVECPACGESICVECPGADPSEPFAPSPSEQRGTPT